MTTDLTCLAYPLPEDIARLEAAGELRRAERVIELRLNDARVPELLKKRLRFEKRILDELPHTYTLSRGEVLARLCREIEGFTEEELTRFQDDGTLDWVYIDGQERFKDDCAESLLKTRTELRPRLLDKAALTASAARTRELQAMLAKMKAQGHVHLRFRLRTTLSVCPEAQEPGKRIRVHMPIPLRDGQCTPGEIRTWPEHAYLAPEDAAQRTAFFDCVYQPGLRFVTECSYDIDAPYVSPDPELVSPVQPHFDTEELPPHIVFTPFIRDLTAELKGSETNPLRIARRFYDYVTTNACYRYVPPYFTKTNIPEYFGAGLRGDCGMHALLFITLCRCAGIPAQWQAGLYSRPGSVGNHDWARFYVAPYGWLYADGSFGGSAYRDGDLERWNFYFGNLDPWRMVSNRAFQQELTPPRLHLRADPYDNQRGEVEYEDRGLRHWEFETEREVLEWEEIL